MSKPVITVENLSKSFTLQHQKPVGGYLALRDVLTDKVKSLYKPGKNSDPTTEVFWALKDVSFEVNQGDRVGIIGRNGAGKSTLLKVLSRIVPPTQGKITIEGRVASLLEVGTGFHPELTGRENIFLNGAILGMNKAEIKSKFDEIVDFSGVEKFLDTPVKRFSSGMYVRLAFAVAAHLEPEILIIDEVLAVGDAEFQKKCLGKMEDVSKSGRTIVFVSHNMAAIQNLCNLGIYLNHGTLIKTGDIMDVTNDYLENTQVFSEKLINIKKRGGNGKIKFTDGSIRSEGKYIEAFKDLEITLEYTIPTEVKIMQSRVDIGIDDRFGQRVAWLSTTMVKEVFDLKSHSQIKFLINKIPLSPGDYKCSIHAQINNEVADSITEALTFTIIEKDYYGTGGKIPHNQGSILLEYQVG